MSEDTFLANLVAGFFVVLAGLVLVWRQAWSARLNRPAKSGQVASVPLELVTNVKRSTDRKSVVQPVMGWNHSAHLRIVGKL